MLAKDLAQLYTMQPHAETGVFQERHYAAPAGGRPNSGSIYYYLSPGERADFHVVDCDEYWAYHCGEPLEMWILEQDGGITKRMLGLGEGREPLLMVRPGTVFAVRHLAGARDGTFVSCITAPRFQYEGWHLYTRDEALQKWPQLKEFYE